MPKALLLMLVLGAAALLARPGAAAGGGGAKSEGERLYGTRCATCHDNARDNIPMRLLLERKSPEAIVAALTTGRMQAMAAGLAPAEKEAIAGWLSKRPRGLDPDPGANRCAGTPQPVRFGPQDWRSWGAAPGNSLYQAASGLTAADVPRLRVKWAFAFPGGTAVAEPVAVGGTLFLATAQGVMALDAATGCTRWRNAVPARKMLTAAALPDSPDRVLLFTGSKGSVYALSADSGDVLWQTVVEEHGTATITGPVVVEGGRAFVGVSSLEDPMWHDPGYPCCTFRGSVVALDAATGQLLWKSHTVVAENRPLGRANAEGTALYGPAGGAVYAPLAVDRRRGLVYAATAESYHHDGEPGTNAIIAFDMATGDRRWTQQPRPADNAAHCRNQDEEDGCSNRGSALFEFAAAPALAHLPDGRDLLLAGQKSGVVYAFDPDRGGQPVWQVRVGEGGSLGGVQHGFAVADGVAYVPVSDTAVKAPFRAGGLAAIDLATGRLLRRTPAPPATCSWTGGSCSSAFASSPAAIPGVVFAGAWDGHMRAFRMADGALLWDVDTARGVDAVNGVKAVGGAIGGYPVIAAGGALYVTSGGGVIENEGNALLAFTVDGR